MNNMEEQTLTYSGYLALSETQRKTLPEPLLTVRWVDYEEVPALTKQTWFSRLRDELNLAGKVTFNLGFFSYEQAGVAKEIGPKESFDIVRDIFKKTEPVTVNDYKSLLSEISRQPVFEPKLVIIDGELRPAVNAVRLMQHYLTVVSKVFGMETTKVQDPIEPEGTVRCLTAMSEVVSNLGIDLARSTELANKDPGNLRTRVFRGQPFVECFLFGAAETPDRLLRAEQQHAIAFPPQAISQFVQTGGFGARVLGWLEHGRPGEFFVRAIGMATVDILRL